MPPCILSKTNQGANHTQVVWQVAECTQPFQLDVWASSHAERDDIVAQLDGVLRAGLSPLGGFNPDPVGNGFFVNLADGWDSSNTTAKFSFDSPDYEDSPDSFGRQSFRATYRGTAYMKLTITASSPRQRFIRLAAFLDGIDQPSTDTTITSEG